jgi:SAM-dependent methyltransferase
VENVALLEPGRHADLAVVAGLDHAARINLSIRKRRVVQEIFRVLRPGGRISITDIVSAKQLSQTIVNDPKLWAS